MEGHAMSDTVDLVCLTGRMARILEDLQVAALAAGNAPLADVAQVLDDWESFCEKVIIENTTAQWRPHVS